jgi:molybdate transport system regulatory protein
MTEPASRRRPPPGFMDALGHKAADKRIDILRAIGRSGSISQAARDAGVSYKAAWQAVATLTNLAGVPLVDKAVGGAGGGGAVLTAEGLRLLTMADELLAARSTLWPAPGAGAAVAGLAIRTSMRNQWLVRIEALEGTGPTLHVALVLGESAQPLQARITRESAELLGLAAGMPALALCKATAVRVEAAGRTRANNQLQGVVSEVVRGPEGDEVALQLEGAAMEVVGFAPAGSGLRRRQRVAARVDPVALVLALPA